MKTKILFSLLLVFAFPLYGVTQTAEEIVAKNIAARGGAEKFAAIHSLTMKTVDHANWGGTGDSVLQLMRPNRIRLDYNWQANPKSEVIRIIMASDGKVGWWADEHKGLQSPKAMTTEQMGPLQESASWLFATSLNDMTGSDIKAELVGSADVDSNPCYKIRFTTASGHDRYAYYDEKSFLIVRYDVVMHTKNDKEKVFTAELSDYKSENGILFPHSFKAYSILTSAFALAEMLPLPIAFPMRKKDSSTSTVETIEINPDMQESLFRSPTAAVSELVKQ